VPTAPLRPGDHAGGVDLELRHMRYVVVLAEELHFTRAAARLGLAQSALSAQLSRLERHLEVTLFERSPRSVRLTPAGEELVARAGQLLADAGEMERDLRTLARQPTAPRSLRIVAETVHPEVVNALTERHPGMAVTLRHDSAEDGVTALAADGADVCHGWDLPSVPLRLRPGIAQATLVDEPMWAVLPEDHPLAGAAQISLTQLRTAAWVSPGPGTRRAKHLLAVCQAAGFTPDIRYVVDDQEMVRTLLANGCCVDLAPPRHLPEQGCRAVRLVEDVRARLFYAWRRSSVPGWLAREILEVSRDAFVAGLLRRGPEYARLVEQDPSRFGPLIDRDPVGWPPARAPRPDPLPDPLPGPRLVSTA
jgi:LysR family transcriptional regulator, benzoate and cis,cis-muconate-responsive activator of ben and cat genes